MKLSVNILNWNNVDILKETLDLLQEELFDTDHEVIVIDNGSTDGSKNMLAERLETYPDGRLSAVSLLENVGISIGKNAGVKLSQGEYIFMLDADIIPVRNSIQMLMEYLDENKDCDAIGMYPNKWTMDKNTESAKYHEDYCVKLFEPRIAKATCLFYGMYRKSIFDVILMDEEGEFGKPGYGWEDHDFFMQMKKAGFTQWVAHINHEIGRYYHAINSSIKNNNCLGREKYMETSRKRAKQYHAKWPKKQ